MARLVLVLLSAGLAAAWWPATPPPALPLAHARHMSPAPSPRHVSAGEDAGRILARPLFDKSRRPARFAALHAGGPAATPPRLRGTIVTPAGATGLFQSGEGKVTAHRRGDRLGDWLVASVTAGRAVLVGPGGTLETALPMAQKADPAAARRAVLAASGVFNNSMGDETAPPSSNGNNPRLSPRVPIVRTIVRPTGD